MTNEIIYGILKSNKDKLKKFGINQIGLFGSFARNEQTESSDIDILVVFDPEKENFDNFMAAYDELEKLFSNYKIEVVTKNGLSPYIGPQILKEVKYA